MERNQHTSRGRIPEYQEKLLSLARKLTECDMFGKFIAGNEKFVRDCAAF